jgi:hypothetical protein
MRWYPLPRKTTLSADSAEHEACTAADLPVVCWLNASKSCLEQRCNSVTCGWEGKREGPRFCHTATQWGSRPENCRQGPIKVLLRSLFGRYHVKWVPVTTAWSVLRLWMEETASRYGGYPWIYLIGNRVEPITGGPTASGLGKRLKLLTAAQQIVMKCYTGPRTGMNFVWPIPLRREAFTGQQWEVLLQCLM